MRGVDGDLAVVTTSLAPAVSEILPSGLEFFNLYRMRSGQRVLKVIVIDGPCASVFARVRKPPGPSPKPGALARDGDCRLTGKVVVTVRRR